MKKVLFVATVVKTHIMVFHIPYLKLFKENGYEVHVCARNDYEVKEDCKIPFCDKYYDLPFERSPFKWGNKVAYNNLKEIITNNKYDIIHCHTPVGGALTRLAARRARKNGTKVIYTAHGFHFFRGAPLKNWLIYYSVERFLSRYTDVLITINAEDFERVKKSFKADNIKYIPGVGIDIDKFSKTDVNQTLKRKSLKLPKDAFVMLSVGELNKNKNHEVVIRALAKLNNSKIHYVVCGQGPLEKHLKSLIKELNLKNQVHLLGFRTDVAEIYKISDIFIFPSFREGLSVALMEAMASQLPVICSNIRGNSDLINDGEGGYLVKPNSVEEIVYAINKMTKDLDLRENMGQVNLEKVKLYSLGHVKKQMQEIYREVLINEK